MIKVLFISRAFPPVIGGIEKQNKEVFTYLAEKIDVTLIANTKGKKFLLLFLPYVCIKSILICRKYDVVLLGDGVLGIVGFCIKKISKVPVVSILHGLDLTYKNKIYQRLWVNVFIRKLDKLIAVGNETVRQARLRGILQEKLIFIPNGVTIKENLPHYSKHELERLLGRKIEETVLLTIGRLVKRKGIAWFLKEVMPTLGEGIIYVIAGAGEEVTEIKQLISRCNMQDQVFFLGKVTEKNKEILYSTADIFVQPNIKVEGDMEGFGLVVLEAASYGMPVVASNLEGLKDAIQDGKNGSLVEPMCVNDYRDKILALAKNKNYKKRAGDYARIYVSENFSWKEIIKKYVFVLRSLKIDSLIK